MRYRGPLAAGCILLACSACGFKGPLYLPERNARVVTHPAPAARGAPAGARNPPAPSKDKRNGRGPGEAPPAQSPTPPAP